MKESLQIINLNIYGICIQIECPKSILKWIEHDYRNYLSDNLRKNNLKFVLKLQKPNKNTITGLIAKKYHEDYIVYEAGNMRAIDYFNKALIIYNIKENRITFFSESKEFLYNIFYTAFETLVGEKLDENRFHRIHCLALEKNGKAIILLLPPGAGKTTLALKFLENKQISVLSEDVALYKNGKIYGLHFRWGTREKTQYKSRLMKREKYLDKFLIDSSNFKLSNISEPGYIILGKRWIKDIGIIKRIQKRKMLMPLFKSMVLGLELQQSLAYFLLRSYKEAFSKINVGYSRMKAMLSLVSKSRCYEMLLGENIENNYRILSEFAEGVKG